MATYTPNLNLKKPEGTDYVLIGDLNGNMDALDNIIGNPAQLNTADKTNIVLAINEVGNTVTNLPTIGENGNWYEWDAATAMYVDSGVPAQGSQGAPGADGQPGKDGAAATIAIGTVADGQAASVVNSGTESTAILDFVLPRGRDGENGSDGISATVQVGTVTEGDAASVVNSGTENAAVLDFVIPRGRDGTDGTDGQPGADGQPGQAATIQIGTVTSGDAPSVTNSGTENAAVLDFVLQRGPQGETGRGFKVLGYYATLEALEADVTAPEVGDAYGVGAAAPYDIYIYDGVTLSWVNNGALQGAKGDDGRAATVTVGTVAEGDAPSVTNSGTATDAILDFVLKTGADGQPGQDGAAAGFGVPTITAAALAAGAEPTASVVATGPDTAKVFAFELGIPAGQDGAPGADGSPGADGQAATIAIGTVTDGDAAAVTNSGTENAAVLDFVLPSGKDGENGAPGAAATITIGTVTSGDAPSVTNSGTENAAVLDFVLQPGEQGEKGDPGAPPAPVYVLLNAAWEGSGPYTQAVAVEGATALSRVDLQPDNSAIAQLMADGVSALYLTNDNGAITAHAVGAAPTAPMLVQATVTDLSAAPAIGYTVETLPRIELVYSDTGAAEPWFYADSFTFADGSFALTDPQETAVSATDYADTAPALLGKYAAYEATNNPEIYYFPADAEIAYEFVTPYYSVSVRGNSTLLIAEESQ